MPCQQQNGFCPWIPNITMGKIIELLRCLVLYFQLQRLPEPLHLMRQGLPWAGGTSGVCSPRPLWDSRVSLLSARIQFPHKSMRMTPRSGETLLGMSRAKLFNNSELSKVLGPSLNDRIPSPADFQEGTLTCSHSINPGQKPQVGELHTARYCYYYLHYMEEETGPEAPPPPPRL